MKRKFKIGDNVRILENKNNFFHKHFFYVFYINKIFI